MNPYLKFLTRLVFLILTNLLTTVRSEPKCGNISFAKSSSYERNLKSLLSNLSTKLDSNGFLKASWGQTPDIAHVMVLCRGDIELHLCHRCVQEESIKLEQACPNDKQAIIWSNLCMLRYSNNASIFRTMELEPAIDWPNAGNINNPSWSMPDLAILLQDLTSKASNGNSVRKVAADHMSRTDSNFSMWTIYALVQCTPNLPQKECSTCLDFAVQRLTNITTINHGAVPEGARILVPSCNLRYEHEFFYNEARLRELQPSPGNTRTIIIVVVSIVVGLTMVIVIAFIIWKRIQKPEEESEHDEMMEDISIVESLHYEFGVIKAATNDFSEANKLGQGGFGPVYKGKLPNGQDIAAKRLCSGSSQGDLEFKNEVVLLAKLQHKNLVRLLGFSLKRPEKLLVYEFVQNASLDRFLFDPTKHSHLDWDRRNKIIWGIARGILYLHEDSRHKIIHRDLKASNILLDGEMNPKIADFGMARLFVPDETQEFTKKIVGTFGYMAPEYLTTGQFSVKSDVFSFGVLLLEIISGQKNSQFQHSETKKGLISSAWETWQKGTLGSMIDPVLLPASSSDILRCIHIGLLCVQENAADRPTMASVIIMLNSLSVSLPLPSPPAFYMHNIGNHLEPWFLQESNCNGRSLNRSVGEAESDDLISQNQMSHSDFLGR